MINMYHEKYHEQLKEKKENILSTDDDYSILMYADLIPKNSKFEFIPSLFGHQIPLNSAGYMLTIVIVIFTFIATFLVIILFADVSKL